MMEGAVSKDRKSFDPARRELFRKSAVAAVGLAVAGVTLSTEPAAAKMSQKGAMYRSKPNGTQKCSGCARFKAGPTPNADGTCAIVEGKIAPEGWCVMYTPK